MVSTFLPRTSSMEVRQEGTGLPSISTVQARHWPSPQPNLVPVRPRSSRSTSRSERLASVETLRGLPLRLNSTVAFIPIHPLREVHVLACGRCHGEHENCPNYGVTLRAICAIAKEESPSHNPQARSALIRLTQQRKPHEDPF